METKDLTIVFENNNEAVTNSRLVAECFEKRHSDILRAIEKLNCSKEFSQRNFALTSYIDRQGKNRPEYFITKDGFTMLAMGFTGAKAMQFKEAYINAFNKMEHLLKGNETILQLEKRIQALEEAHKPFKKVTEESIIQDYFTAIQQALRSGKYYLKRRKGNASGTGQLLGTYDMFTYSLIGQKSYDIYKEYADEPVHRQALYNLLLTRGYLIPPSQKEIERTKSKSVTRKIIYSKQYRCLVIKTSKTPFALL